MKTIHVISVIEVLNCFSVPHKTINISINIVFVLCVLRSMIMEPHFMRTNSAGIKSPMFFILSRLLEWVIPTQMTKNIKQMMMR